MRLAFTADFHGSLDHFSSFLGLARREQAAVAIVGGDLFPVSRPYEEMLRSQRQFAMTVLRDVLLNHFALNGCPVCLLSGNNDWHGAFEELEGVQQEGLVVISEPTISPLGEGYVMVALPYVPPTPFRLKDFDRRDLAADPAPEQPNPIYYSVGDEVRQADIREYLSQRLSIEEELEKLRLATLEAKKTIYVMHSPPFGTGLDRTASRLDAGSKAIRVAIEDNQPLLALHGHIHEAPAIAGTYACRLGRTIAVNPGQTIDRLHAVIVDLTAEISLRHTVFGALTLGKIRQAPRRNRP